MAAVVAIHAGLGFALLQLSGTVDLTDPQSVLQVIDIREVKPPPPEPPPPPPQAQKQAQKEKPKEKEGGSAPKNLRSEATPVVAPKPRIEIPPKIAVTETPREGTGPTQGASDVRGPGTGAGGIGTGTGSGAGGSGPGGGGGGGDGGIASRAQLVSGPLRNRDFPPHLRRILSGGGSPFVIFTVQANGRVSNCRIYQSSGYPELDNTLCALVTSRLVYRPATNRAGYAVESQAAYRQAR